MKRVITANLGLMLASVVFVLGVPLFSIVQLSQALEGVPPVGQTLVREGTFAIELAKAFDMPGDVNEVAAESWLADAGVSPLNGWIADYPITPDIIGELRKAVGDAVGPDKINLDKDEALNRFDRSLAAAGLDLKPLNSGQYARVAEFNNDIVPAGEVVNYYAVEGPPVVSYYAPPPYYYGMYSWISYPFWCGGYWFGGYFILNDFQRTVFIGRDHHRGFVSNHFRDRSQGRFSRIDPQTRSAGVTATVSGMSGGRIPTPAGTGQSIRSSMNPSRENAPPAIRSTTVNTNSNPARSNAPPVIRSTSFNTPGSQRGSRGDDRITTSTGWRNSATTSSYTPVRAPEMPARTFTAPRNSSAVTRIYSPSPGITPQNNYSRSMPNGFSGGSTFRGGNAGFGGGSSFRGGNAGFGGGGGHARR